MSILFRILGIIGVFLLWVFVMCCAIPFWIMGECYFYFRKLSKTKPQNASQADKV